MRSSVRKGSLREVSPVGLERVSPVGGSPSFLRSEGSDRSASFPSVVPDGGAALEWVSHRALPGEVLAAGR